MKTIKIIDLLNKIANGKEVPYRIIYGKYVYVFNSEDGEFYSEVGEKALFEDLFSFSINFLNDEVEIIEEYKEIVEEVKENKIEKIEKKFSLYLIDSKIDYESKDAINDIINELIKKVDKIIDVVNKGKNNENN